TEQPTETEPETEFTVSLEDVQAAALTFLKERGCKHVRFMCLVAAPEGIRVLQEEHPDIDIFTASVDECLNENCYIVPGLGDAGDRIFGTK
ncbi:MAG TPA: hypothetical protein O0Y16_01030, partial [Methanocorpusculum sp.]|nr:hypothetical protein [Methanocorpusculum sp.]